MTAEELERFGTRLGPVEIRFGPQGVRELRLLERSSDDRGEEPPQSALGQEIAQHLAGGGCHLSRHPIDMSGATPFEREVYREARRIPSGTVVTYGELARRLGKPTAARAVGGALGRNRHLLLVPCHRVTGAAEKLTGFSAPGGVETKRLILAAEGVGVESLFDYGELARAEAVLSADPLLAPIVRAVGPCRIEPRNPGRPFAALVHSVIFQQLATSAARAIEERVQALNSGQGGELPGPSQLQTLGAENLRACGLSQAKVDAILNLARATLEGEFDPEELELLPDDIAIREVCKLKGFGPWSAKMVLMFHLGRRDRLPLGDLAIRKALQTLDPKSAGVPDPRKRWERLSLRWRPYRTAASWYLWRSLALPLGTGGTV